MQTIPMLIMAGVSAAGTAMTMSSESSASKAATQSAQAAQLQQARGAEADAVTTASQQSVGARLAAMSGRRLLTFDGFGGASVGAGSGNGIGVPTGISPTLGG